MKNERADSSRIEELQRGLMESQDTGERAAIHLELGRIALGDGRIEAAVRHLREALLLDRRLEQARRLLVDLGEASRMTVDKARNRRKSVRNLLSKLRRS